MLLAKIAKVGDYVRYAESDVINVGTLWRVVENSCGRVTVRPDVEVVKFAKSCPTALVLRANEEVVGGSGTKECPYEIK